MPELAPKLKKRDFRRHKGSQGVKKGANRGAKPRSK
jgi:hypothetical protein